MWLDSNMGKKPNVSFCVLFLTGARLNKLLPDNVMGLKILKWKCVQGFI